MSLSVTQLAWSPAAQRQEQWHYWGGTLTSLRRNSDLPEDGQSKAGQLGDRGRFYQQSSNHWAKAGQQVRSNVSLGSVSRSGSGRAAKDRPTQWHSLGCSKGLWAHGAPNHGRRANGGQSGPVRPVGVPRAPAAVCGAQSGTWAWVLDCKGVAREVEEGKRIFSLWSQILLTEVQFLSHLILSPWY